MGCSGHEQGRLGLEAKRSIHSGSRCSGGCEENQGSGRRLRLVGMDPEGKNESGGGADGIG